MKEIQAIIAKKDWEALQEGKLTQLDIYNEKDLHHVFGDEPEEYIVRVKISLAEPSKR